MHLRLQSWFPFPVNVCLNGRQWLGRQMAKAGIKFEQRDKCFTWIEDLKKAQRLAEKHLQIQWPPILNKLILENHPTHRKIWQPLPISYCLPENNFPDP